MQTYLYTSLNQQGRRVRGRMMASNEEVLEKRLRSMGLWLMEAEVDDGSSAEPLVKPRKPVFARGNRREMIDLCTLMSVQLRAGVSMLSALETAAADTKSRRYRVALEEVRRLVEAGESLHDAMRRFPACFPPYFTSLIKAGEESGTLPDTFAELKRYLEWQEQIISDVRQATIYPVIVLLCVILFVLGLFSYVIPKFEKLLATAGAELPTITKVVFALGDFAERTWWIWLLALVVIPVVIQILKSKIHTVGVLYDRVKFRVPLFGELNRMLVMARFAHNLSMLYKSGIVIINALKLCEDLLRSALMIDVLTDVRERVTAGESLSEACRKHAVFPPLVIRMLSMGERTGALDEALDNVATYYNTVVPRTIKKVFSVAEPMLILTLVGIVGCVALAVFMPILSLMSAARR